MSNQSKAILNAELLESKAAKIMQEAHKRARNLLNQAAALRRESDASRP